MSTSNKHREDLEECLKHHEELAECYHGMMERARPVLDDDARLAEARAGNHTQFKKTWETHARFANAIHVALQMPMVAACGDPDSNIPSNP